MKLLGPTLKTFAAALTLVAPVLASAQASGVCAQANPGQGWTNQSFVAQRGRFTTTIEITPGNNQAENLIGLSQGAKSDVDQFAALLRFNAEGFIEARNGTAFEAVRRVRYHPEVTYVVRIDVDTQARTYSAWVQRPHTDRGRPFRRIAKDFALGAAQVAQLDTLGVFQAQPAVVDPAATAPTQACNQALRRPEPQPPNPDCTLIVPPDPLSPQGLATPYQLVATDPAQGECRQVNPDQSAFVEAVIIDPATGQVSIYAPLVIDRGSRPAAPPVVPVLPPNAIVGIWFGYNGDNLTLRGGSRNALSQGRCVNGLGNSVFGQFAYCNAPAFFDAAFAAVRAGTLVVPPLGTGIDGQVCPSARSYWVIDQDPSDNVPAEYLEINGRFAQATAANRARFPQARTFGNPSDERLVSVVLDPVLKCTPFSAPNLADPGAMVTSLALNEVQAAVHQQAPIALIPPQDPMVLVDERRNLRKLNLYRAGVGQPLAKDVSDASAAAACRDYRRLAPERFIIDRSIFDAAPSPAPDEADSLFTFLANRYVNSYELLDCRALLRQRVNMVLRKNAQGVVVDARLR